MDTRGKTLLTVEGATYALLALLAVGLRWFQLGLPPLSEGEAVQALAAYRFLQGGTPSVPAGTIPALFTGNLVGFTLFGASDSTARLMPMLAGLVLVLLPYGLRHRLGRGGAIVASLLLAISPTAVHFSRSVDGAILVAACGLAFAVGLIRYVDTLRPGALLLAAGALGLGLCSGPAIFTLLLLFALFALLLYLLTRLTTRAQGWAAALAAWHVLRAEKGLALRAGAVLAAAFGLAATALILYPGGVGLAADLIATWIQGFLPVEGRQPALYPLLLLLRYELLILVFGLVEAGRAVAAWLREAGTRDAAESFPHSLFLAFWALGALVLVVASGQRPAGNLLLVVVPLALLAGQGIERAWRWVNLRSVWAEAGLVAGVALGLAFFLYLQVTAYSATDSVSTVSFAGISTQTQIAYLLLALLALVLLAGLATLVRLWRGPDALRAGGWLALLALLGVWDIRAMWGLNHAHAADPRELMIIQTTAPEIRALVQDLERLSLDEFGDGHTLPITVDAATGPVLTWYLRQFGRQQIVEGLSAPPTTTVAVTLAQQNLPIGEGFRGQGYPLREFWQPWSIGFQPLIRWLLFSHDGQPAVEQEVVLWVLSPAQSP